MTEKLDDYIFIRLTPTFKERFLKYCEDQGYLAYSEYIRVLLNREMKKGAAAIGD